MFKVSVLLRRLQAEGVTSYDHKNLHNLLSGIRGKFQKEDIRSVRNVLNSAFAEVDKKLQELEKE